MRWSFKIGRIFGITLRLHVTFLLLLAFIGYYGFEQWGFRGAMWSLIWFSSMFVCILLHELGHSLVAQQLGVEVKSITMLPIGGVAALKRIPENPWHEIAITLAGPMVNLAIAVVLLPFIGFKFKLFPAGIPENFREMATTLAGTNVWLFLFNLIPAFPMDGGRLLRALLATALPHPRATSIAATVGQGMAIIFVVLGLSTPWLRMLIIIGVLLRELFVGNVMNRKFTTLSPLDPLSRSLELLYQTGHDSFLVSDHGQLAGTLTREIIVDAVNKFGTLVRVADVMDVGVPTVSPQTRVSEVYEEMVTEGHACFPVMQDGEVAGLISLENISRYMLVHSSLKAHRRFPLRLGEFAQTPMLPPVIATVPPVAAPPPLPEPSRPADPA